VKGSDTRWPWGKGVAKLDVADSIPVARSNDDAGLQSICSPAFALTLV
jgi:hypothetical protein